MDMGHHSEAANSFDREAVGLIVPYILRLILAISVALIVLAGLLCGLSTVSRRTQAGSLIVPSQSTANEVPTLCQTPTLNIVKVADPSEPEVGGVITITFIITGLNLKPVDVVLALDVSSSMYGSRIDAAKAAAEAFVTRTQATDWIAVVAFSSTAWLTQPWTTDKYDVITTIRGTRTEECESACTNIEDGIYEAYQALIAPTHDHVSGTVKAIILLSDGLANRSNHPDDPWTDTYTAEVRALNRATETRKCGILIYTIGLGRNPNKTLLQGIADITDGKYFAATDVATLAAIYQEIAMELRNIVITDVLRPGANVDCDRMPGGWGCFEGPDGFTTVTYTISDERPVDDPLVLSFTATVNLTPDYETQPVNAPGSCSHYDGPGNPFSGPDDPPCQDFENPPRVCIRPYLTDTYEPDGDCSESRFLTGTPQLHNFSHSDDTDWVGGELKPGRIYTFVTAGVSDGVGDRFLELYTGKCSTGLTLLGSGTNTLTWSSSSLFRPLVFKDAHSMMTLGEPRYYYLRVSSLDNRFGCGTQYELLVERSPLSGITITANPSTHIIYQGQSAAYVLSVNAAQDFTWPVTLTVNTLSDIASTLSPEVLWRGQSATLTATTELTTPAGSYTLTVSGAGSGLSDTIALALGILPADFSLGVTPSGCTMLQGEIASSLIELASATPGFVFPVALSVGGIPTGTFSVFAPLEIISGTQATLFITTTGATPLGSYGLTITGTVGELERSTTATLRVVKAKIFLPIIMKE